MSNAASPKMAEAVQRRINEIPAGRLIERETPTLFPWQYRKTRESNKADFSGNSPFAFARPLAFCERQQKYFAGSLVTIRGFDALGTLDQSMPFFDVSSDAIAGISPPQIVDEVEPAKTNQAKMRTG